MMNIFKKVFKQKQKITPPPEMPQSLHLKKFRIAPYGLTYFCVETPSFYSPNEWNRVFFYLNLESDSVHVSEIFDDSGAYEEGLSKFSVFKTEEEAQRFIDWEFAVRERRRVFEEKE